MLGLLPTKVRLLPYDAQWSAEFAKEQEQIETVIGEYILSITHIGSTSIPGLCAKPIIDILIGLTCFQDGFNCVTGLEKLDYTFRGENGIPGRHYFRKGTPRTHHIHMFAQESQSWKDHVLFCNYLRKHPDERIRYAELKKALAKKFPNNREQYTASKANFIKSIIKRARAST